jgi:hypothetical protein
VSEYIKPTRIRPTLVRSTQSTSSSRLPTSYTPGPRKTTPTTEAEEDKENYRLGGPAFITSFKNDKPKIPFVKKNEDKLKQNGEVDEARRKEVIGNSIDGAIVESIPANELTAEDTDPQTKCQSTCGKNEVCQISSGGKEINCKCRPGFGRSKLESSCESK